MGKVFCFIYNEMADFEMTFAAHITETSLRKEIIPIAYEKEMLRGVSGLCYYPKLTVKEALELDDVEGLIIPGGWNDEQRPELTELIQRLHRENKMLAAICAAPRFLARAGVLEDKKYTTTLTKEVMEKEKMEDPFPRETFVEEEVVRDGNIVTATGRTFVDFAFEICDYFNAFEKPEHKELWSKHYKGM